MNKFIYILFLLVLFGCNTSKKASKNIAYKTDSETAINTVLTSKIDSFSYELISNIIDSTWVVEIETTLITSVIDYDSLGNKKREQTVTENKKQTNKKSVVQKSDSLSVADKVSEVKDSTEYSDKKKSDLTLVEKQEYAATNGIRWYKFIIPSVILVIALLFYFKIIKINW